MVWAFRNQLVSQANLETLYLAIALAAFTVSLAAPLMPRAPFGAYFGPLPSPLAVIFVAGLGLLAVRRLQAVGWTPPGWTSPRRLACLAALGAAFALPTVALDIALPFPIGINAPLPEALAFYPAVGFVAETVFHLLPFALLSLLIRGQVGTAIVIGALIEPAFQVAAGAGPGQQGALMAAILFGFGLVQMTALHRHGFAAAFALRIGYYLVWHIGWGAARLPLLFAP